MQRHSNSSLVFSHFNLQQTKYSYKLRSRRLQKDPAHCFIIYRKESSAQKQGNTKNTTSRCQSASGKTLQLLHADDTDDDSDNADTAVLTAYNT